MSEADWIGIYKGLRLPLLMVILGFIVWYVFRPNLKDKLEQAKYNMLMDDDTKMEKDDE